MSYPEFEPISSNRTQARKNAYGRVMVGFDICFSLAEKVANKAKPKGERNYFQNLFENGSNKRTLESVPALPKKKIRIHPSHPFFSSIICNLLHGWSRGQKKEQKNSVPTLKTMQLKVTRVH